MLELYKKETNLIVPYTGYRYSMNINLVLYDNFDDVVIEKDQTNHVCIAINNQIGVSVKFEWLVAMTFKPLSMAESFMMNWSVLFADGSAENFHPVNLIWQPPAGGQDCPELPGYKVIPGFSNYAISAQGAIWSRQSSMAISTRKAVPSANNSYINANLTSDAGHKTVLGVHRAIALAFLTYDRNVCKMTVNHDDGVKSNNHLKNLAWATYSENNTHAKDSGLNRNRRKILIKDYWEDIVLEFSCARTAGDELNLKPERIYMYASDIRQSLIEYRYAAKFADDSSKNWPSVDVCALKEQYRLKKEEQGSGDCCARNIFTDEVFIASGRTELAKMIGVSKDTVDSSLESKIKWPCQNHVFWFFDEAPVLRPFASDELIAFKDQPKVTKPVRVTKSDGTRQVFVSMTECARQMKLNEQSIMRDIRMNGGIIMTSDGFIIKYIEF